ncbi:hypothetical protein K1719_030989 [Acacia pycnantha]|nr:hypothetical protein K1719_030989 [Acacia pycnantha]
MAALTLCSSNSFSQIETKVSKPHEVYLSSKVSFAWIKSSPSSFRLRATSDVTVAGTGNKVKGLDLEASKEELHHPALVAPHKHDDSMKVPVFVMLPLDTVTMGGTLNKARAMNASLMALKTAGVEGVMVDAWWGLVEKDGPMSYN